jgi:hypothetical protein
MSGRRLESDGGYAAGTVRMRSLSRIFAMASGPPQQNDLTRVIQVMLGQPDELRER